MLTLLPAGMKGLLVASLFAAYRSTMETHLNWGSSYLVIDFYQRFMAPGRAETHYLWVSRGLTAFLMFTCGLCTLFISTASEGFQLLLSIGAGTGLIYLLRWFWWRINAWSEISAMAGSFLCTLTLFVGKKALGWTIPDHWALIMTVAVTTAIWVTVTLMTRPTDEQTLDKFYTLTRPAGPGWKAVRARTGLAASPDSLSQAMLGWTAGCAFIYSALFGAGNALYGRSPQALFCLGMAVVSGIVVYRVVSKMFRGDPASRGA
jgi:uncharacterized sodium:solute symporter family permease YidK